MMGCLCVNKNGVMLCDSIIYCDQCALVESDEIVRKIDAFEFYKITGHQGNKSD